MREITILGSTGSIGTQTLEIIDENKTDFKIIGLACNKNSKKLIEQIETFSPEVVFIQNFEGYEKVKRKFPKLFVYTGNDIKKIIDFKKPNIVVNALVGFAGVEITIHCIKNNINIALANKESLVSAGHIITNLTKKYNVQLFPIDSEHSAIWQILRNENCKKMKKIIITCSGGPFRNLNLNDLKNVTKDDALKHPNWNMGKKITIDSATVMNKALEIIEAKWLFEITGEKIIPVLHPESIVHSMVEFADNSVLAQLSVPNMLLPISYALYEGKRRNITMQSIDFSKNLSLHFYPMDHNRWEALKIIYQIFSNSSLCTIFNAANEKNVALFLNNKIKFHEIVPRNHKIIKKYRNIENNLNISDTILLHTKIINEIEKEVK